jgi:hypothetical protein
VNATGWYNLDLGMLDNATILINGSSNYTGIPNMTYNSTLPWCGAYYWNVKSCVQNLCRLNDELNFMRICPLIIIPVVEEDDGDDEILFITILVLFVLAFIPAFKRWGKELKKKKRNDV